MTTSVSLQILTLRDQLLFYYNNPQMSDFSKQVFKIVKSIPKGKVASYGQIALLAGYPRGARQVGWTLNKLTDGTVPWWRVINNSGRVSIKHSEYSALEQKTLLENEGIPVTDNFEIDINKYRF
jgi:methylated-DNA-protein-cysteine methyltransferase related protein